MLSLVASQGRKMLTASGCAYAFVCLCSCPWMPFDLMIAGYGQTGVADSLKKSENERSSPARLIVSAAQIRRLHLSCCYP